MIKKIKFDQFTIFKELTVDFFPGINVFIGTNGTGKTHILKAVYAAADITKTKKNFADKILGVYMPSELQLGRLIYRKPGSSEGAVAITRKLNGGNATLRMSFSNHAKRSDSAKIIGINKWCSEPIESVYIPVKEMLANAPGFNSMVTYRELHFEEIYVDIVNRALTPLLKGNVDGDRRRILEILQNAMKGKVRVKKEEFFLRNKQGNLEFSLLAEGIRKLGLLWMLIQNGTLLSGSLLLWDEPEANLNPKLLQSIVEILLELQRMGVQILVATHDYVFLKELDLQAKATDSIAFHSLYRVPEQQTVAIETTDKYLDIHPNAIAETFTDLYNRDVERAIGRK
ncbi:MAG: AAA family ATPase [Phycisphaerae bacterium]|nr:AAA family ATPase [Phycisphaerae bacterium]